ADVIDTIRALVRERIPRRFRLDPLRDIQILTPMRRGELGVEAINAAMKALLNPSDRSAADRPRLDLTPGDRVMQTANNYDKGVFNGDIGRVLQVNEETREVSIDFDG